MNRTLLNLIDLISILLRRVEGIKDKKKATRKYRARRPRGGA
jgi:hypothetical protein